MHCTELCTLDGTTYVAVPPGVQLPEQPPEIALQPVALTPELKAAISAASVHVQLINERVVMRIRAVYSADEEIAAVRSQPSAAYSAYTAHVEACRAWGAAEKAKLGLRTLADMQAQALADVAREHDQVVLQLTKNPSTSERGSWPVKLELAKAIASGAPLDASAQAFCSLRGLATAEARSAYAAEVLGNAAAFAAVLGLADRVRASAVARIKAATLATWPQVGAQNHAERDAALAQAAKLFGRA